ncbi:glycosyltransferase [Vibrio kanaloae]|uniref:glycosyltransferase family 2 protein n=1 Tax=Vibrio kanaloae TaxID=170673 RepID=UPI0010BE6047|nr:glycosyltransferase [Vibrio kanaloae]TKF80564.1 glycosyltransferase [Vibrio kanaloae]
MNDNFSVVITTKDRPDFLDRCVRSILSNTILPREIIIINDAGEYIRDDNFDIKNTLLNIVNNKISKGANFCRNLGVSLAKTEVVFFIDDDDTFTCDSFETRMSIFCSNADVGLVYTGFHTVFSDNLDMVVSSKKPVTYSTPYTQILLSKGNVIGSTSRVAIRVAAFNKTTGFDDDLSSMQDYDMWIRMSDITKIMHDGHVGINYTIHNGNSNQVSKNYKKYLNSSNYLISKYEKIDFADNYLRAFSALLYLRVAISGADDFKIKTTYSLKSLKKKFSFKALGLLIVPTSFLRLFKYFI